MFCSKKFISNQFRSFSTKSKIVFSGIQPSGIPHIGNYFGALKHWADEQKAGSKYFGFMLWIDYQQCYFGVMSYHALTSVKDPVELSANIK